MYHLLEGIVGVSVFGKDLHGQKLLTTIETYYSCKYLCCIVHITTLFHKELAYVFMFILNGCHQSCPIILHTSSDYICNILNRF